MSEANLSGSNVHHDAKEASFNAPLAPSSYPQLDPSLFQAEKGSILISPTVATGLIRLIEFVLVSALGFGIFTLYVGSDNPVSYGFYLFATIGTAIATVIVFQTARLYRLSALTSSFSQLSRVWIAWTGIFAGLIVTAFFIKVGAEYSRAWLMLWYVAGLLTLSAFRLSIATMIRNWVEDGRLKRRAVIIGGGKNGEELIQALEASKDTNIEICGVFDDRDDDRVSPVIAGYPKLGKIHELVEIARSTRIDLLIVSLPLTAENRLLQILEQLWVLPVDISLSAHTNKLQFRPRSYSYIGDVPLIDVFDKPITDWDFVLKSLFDKCVGVLALLFLSPIMLLTALAIKLDSRGPVLFKQKRYGFNNELIEVYKFRSMYADKSDHQANKLVTKNDPRVTRVGQFIRKTSLDELPQLFNVLKGELSLVGPRPHALQAKAADALYQNVVDGYFARHKVKPGITGWAQVNGWRGETDTQEKIQQRVEHDLYYIENWSVSFDLHILFATPFALLKTENAY